MKSLWMLLSAFGFAVCGACIKYAGDEIPAFEFVFYRGVFGAAVLGIWAFINHKSLKTQYFWGHMKRDFIGSAAMCMWFYSIAFLPLATSTTLNNTNPLFMAAIVVFIAMCKKDPIEWDLVLSVIAGFLGVVLILRPEFHAGDLYPGMVGLASGFFGALAYFQVKQLTALREPEYRVVFYFCMVNALFGIVGHTFFEPPSIYTYRSVFCIFLASASATIAQLSLTYALGHGNLLLSSVMQFSGIIFAIIIGYVVFGTTQPNIAYLGIGLIILAGTFATYTTKLKTRTKAKPGLPGDPLHFPPKNPDDKVK